MRTEEAIDKKLSDLDQKTKDALNRTEPYAVTCILVALLCGIVSGFVHALALETFPAVTSIGLGVFWYATTFGVPILASAALGYWHPGAQGTSHLAYLIIGLSSALGVTVSGMAAPSGLDRAELLVLFLMLPITTWSGGMLGLLLRPADRAVWRPLGQFALAFVPLVLGVLAEARQWQDIRRTNIGVLGPPEAVETSASTQDAPTELESILLAAAEERLEEYYFRSPLFLASLEAIRLQGLITYSDTHVEVTPEGDRRVGMLRAEDIRPGQRFDGVTSEQGAWFRFSVQSAGEFTIDVDSGGDGMLELYDAFELTLLADNDDRSPGEVDPLIRRRLLPGTYLIRVGDFTDDEQVFEGSVVGPEARGD